MTGKTFAGLSKLSRKPCPRSENKFLRSPGTIHARPGLAESREIRVSTQKPRAVYLVIAAIADAVYRHE